jgi:hypothetical protein
MTRCGLVIIVALFFTLTMGSGSPQAEEIRLNAQDSRQESEPIWVGRYLVELALKYDCFLTYEEVLEEGGSTNTVLGYSILKSSEPNSLEDELEYIRLTVPYFSYEIKEGPPRIIHILDTRLVNRGWYGLESTIKSIDFEGLVNDLIVEIGRRGIPVSFREAHFIGEHRDRSTVVKVKGEWLKVRDALTDFVPLEGRKERVLWIARTKLAKGEVSEVYYLWHGKTDK